jgi:hypothetical protein
VPHQQADCAGDAYQERGRHGESRAHGRAR